MEIEDEDLDPQAGLLEPVPALGFFSDEPGDNSPFGGDSPFGDAGSPADTLEDISHEEAFSSDDD
jgi:hypothetical protein